MDRRARYALFALYFVGLLALSRVVTGSWLPATGDTGTWFHSGLLLIVVSTFLFEMFFTKPTDALVNSLMAFVALYALASPEKFVLWQPLIWLSLAVFVAATVAMLLGTPNEDPSSARNRTAKPFYEFATFMGSAKILFSLVFFAAAVSYYRDSSQSVFYMTVFWGAIVVVGQLNPDRLVTSLLDVIAKPSATVKFAGHVTAVVNPRLVDVETDPEFSIIEDEVIVLSDAAPSAEARLGYGLVISSQMYVTHGTLQVLLVPQPGQPENVSDKVGSRAWVIQGAEAPGWLQESIEWRNRRRLVGLVGAGTDIGAMKIRCLDHDRIEEGFLVEAFTRGRWITYQVTGARTTLVSEGVSSGFAATEVTAAQVGSWSDSELGFDRHGWLPALNTPVYLVEPSGESVDTSRSTDFVLGTMPNSGYPVLVDLETLVTHHTAILGITGSGKSRLAQRLIGAIVDSGMKVISVDFTGEHRQDLASLNPVILSDCSKIEATIAKLRTSSNPVKLASHSEITDVLEAKVNGFLSGTEMVGVFELPELSNTSEAIEFTQLFLERVFTYAKKAGGLGRPLCLVLEEAHTVIPEQGSLGTNDWDAKAMVNKIAQIALQGRKYGVGFLVIAQRTANVTKTVLSQCNTVICFSAFDKTGYGFLENYMGSEMVAAVPNLKFLQAVLVGKASHSARPVIVELPYEAAPAVVAHSTDLAVEDIPTAKPSDKCLETEEQTASPSIAETDAGTD